VNYRGATTSPLAMLSTVPGAQQDANGNVSVGGGLPSQVEYSVDGSSTVNIRQNGALGNMNPSSELIGEFKVTQFNNNAEFAQLGDVTISTKSGSKQFHGSAFEYLQNDAFDAEVWNSGDKPHKAYNTFGGSLGGPLVPPRLMHGKAKTFFFADFEANRRRYSTPPFLFVPLNAMRQGDFSALSTPLMDPFTGQPYAGDKIPSGSHCTNSQDCTNPVAQSLLNNYLPAQHCCSIIRTLRRRQRTSRLRPLASFKVFRAGKTAETGRARFLCGSTFRPSVGNFSGAIRSLRSLASSPD
jgi:hypothetical protein